jgi:hypothetical protein
MHRSPCYGIREPDCIVATARGNQTAIGVFTYGMASRGRLLPSSPPEAIGQLAGKNGSVPTQSFLIRSV